MATPPVLSPSSHVDTFTRDNLPPTELWPEFRFDLPELRYPERLNCARALLDDTIARMGADRPCLLTDSSQWTYGELQSLVARLSHVLVDDYGIVPGNRVLLRGPNNPMTVACWFAVLRVGGVVVTTMPLLKESELRVVGDIASIDLSLCDERFVDDLRASDISRVLTFADFADRANTKPDSFACVDTAADDVALLAFTSGTTGRPKATMHFHRDVMANADTFSRHVLKPTADDVFACSPPLGFTFGLGMEVVFPLQVGASSLLLEKGTPDLLLPALERHKATVMATAPTAYRAMLNELSNNKLDLSSLRRCVSAGEPLPKPTWEDWKDVTGCDLIDGIGATEMLHIFISAADGDIRPGSTGRVVPGYQATIMDDDGKELPPGELGRLAVKGPTGCRYLADERQQDYVQNGWNFTGDTYTRDEDGYFWYHSRSDDMIISAGFNISGTEVEWALLSHNDIAECVVVGVPDPDRTMTVKAYVVPRPGADLDADAVIAHCRDRIASYKRPRTVEFVTALPRTSTGKVQRYLLR
ncbi:AMP-binding protein [Stackebrandtia nassauensis]|uniref:AMP-dependent synthetase and ligase n=1 Tax=Stackebrandtia nassauensis (strain DSM 44728 / CIP 108903 / NRRL B-16338 / NBRC 102104 / LLR-40K-21) TaxID=446470 RepID=D3Q5K9_STANL|nr:AMP-binding protein [Stackebrandtia nassauensis]ADD46069.1 AMP-dependent synthetase and ligase [Stackebrandtia nassauensis DSM 44728]